MPGKKLCFEDYEVDFVRRELRKGGIRIRLQRKPFCVLELLLRRPGEVVTREELVRFLWPDSHVSFAHGLNTAVNSLRQALEETSRRCHFIETRPGFGYRFTALLKELPEVNENPGPLRASGSSVDAYEDCLKGRYFLDRMAPEEIYKAIACFRCAARDEIYHSLAHAGIADAYCQLASVGSVCPSQVVCLARSSAESALKNNPDLPEAHVSAARVKMLFDWDWGGARAALDRAFALNSNSAAAHTLHASLLCTLGCYEEAMQACSLALSLNPLSFSANLQLAACLYAARDFKSAIDQCWKMLTLTSPFAPAQIVLALSDQQLGMHEEAIVEFQNAKRCAAFQPAAISGLGHLFAVAGFHTQAEEAFLDLSAQARNRYVSGYCSAVICAGRKQNCQALSFLEQCVELRDPALLWLNADARFDSLRDHERFQIMLGRVGIPALHHQCCAE